MTVSFDGSGDAELWRYWRRVGRRVGARFTFFLSGVYLLREEARRAYLPPRHEPGRSDIGFMQRQGAESSRRRVRELLEQLSLGHREGHEVATHFNGHFCAPYSGNVGEWNEADWRQELSQFDELLTRANALNAIRRPVRLGFAPASVVGSRTPCFQGDLQVLRRVLRERGFVYDSSGSVRLGAWPTRKGGIWSMPLPEIRLVGTNLRVIAMDYNLLVNQEPADAEEQAYRSFMHAFVQVYNGGRAPLGIGSHFARWNHGAYVRAITRFLSRVCRMRAVRCVPYREVAEYLSARERRPARAGRVAAGPSTSSR